MGKPYFIDHIVDGQDAYLLIHLVGMRSWTDDPGMIQFEVFHCYAQGFGGRRRFAELAFHSEASPLAREQEVDLRSLMRGPEKCLRGLDQPDDLLNDKALPGSSNLGIPEQHMQMGNPEQCME